MTNNSNKHRIVKYSSEPRLYEIKRSEEQRPPTPVKPKIQKQLSQKNIKRFNIIDYKSSSDLEKKLDLNGTSTSMSFNKVIS